MYDLFYSIFPILFYHCISVFLFSILTLFMYIYYLLFLTIFLLWFVYCCSLFSKLSFICLNSYLIPDVIDNFKNLSYLNFQLVQDVEIHKFARVSSVSIFIFQCYICQCTLMCIFTLFFFICKVYRVFNLV